MSSHSKLTDGELEILRVIWNAGQCSVRDIHDVLSAGRELAMSTVSVRVTKMEEKGLIVVVDARRPKLYKAAVEQDKTAESMVGDLLKRVFGGSTHRMVKHLLSRKQMTDAERKEIQDELDRMS